MALLWCDSFDYATDDIDYKYGVTGSPSTSLTQSRWSGKRSLYVTTFSDNVIRGLTATEEIYLGVAAYPTAFCASASASDNTSIFCGNAQNEQILGVEVCGPSGEVYCKQGFAGIFATVYPNLLNKWSYVEFWYKRVDGSNDRFVLKINGTTEVDYTGDLTYSSPYGITTVKLMGGYTSGARYYQDFYICDASGSTNNSWLGDVRVQAIRPNGAGNYSQFTPLSGSNYENVDDTDIDGDSSYVSGTAVGVRDTYTMGDISGNRRIYAVASNIVASKASAGANFLKPTLRISSTDYERPALGFGVGYSNQQSIMETSPATDDEFTISEVNALESGFTLYASTTTTTV